MSGAGHDGGHVRVTLGVDLDDQGKFEQFERQKERARREKKITAELGADMDPKTRSVLYEYERQLDKAERRVAHKDRFKAALGAEFDARAWAQAWRNEERALRRREQEHQRHLAAMGRAEAAAHAENARRDERAMRDRERARAVHLRRQERMLGQVTKGAGNFIPDVTWSTRIPVGGLVAFAAAAQAAVPPVVALAGSLAPLVGWLGAIPTVASAAGVGLLTAFLGFKGVGDALGAAWEAQASAGEDAIDTSKRQEAAAERVENAERQLTDAIDAHKDAQDDANDTTREAREEMRRLRGELDDLAASEGDRVEALRRDNEEVGRLRAEGASQREIAQAQRDVTHAEYELTQARDRRREATEKVAQVDKHGIQSLDEVKDAHQRVKDAEERVTEATENVAKANRDATRDTAELTGGAKKLDEAMRELGPAGQAFVTMVATKFFPMVKQLRSTAQEGLLPGLGDGMIEASKNAPILERAIGRIAKTMGDTSLDWGKFLGSEDFGRDFEQIMGQSNQLLDDGGDASIHFASGLRHVAVESEPLVGWLGKVTEQLGLNFEGWAATNRENGRMRAFFRETITTTKDVVGTLVDLGAGLWNIGRIGARVWGNDMRGGIRDAAKDFRDWTESVKGDRSIEQYFTRWRKRWTAVVDYIGDAIDEYRKLRKEGMSATAALTRVLTDRFGEALVNLAERIGRLAPKVAAGFIKGFIEADAWGKLFIGAWLIGKLGGRGAFLAIGRTVGGWLGAAMAAGAMRSGIAMQIASWLKAPERTARMSSAGSVMGRALGLGISAGIVLAVPLIGAAVTEALNDARKKVQSWIEEIPGGKQLVDTTNFLGRNLAPVLPGAAGTTLGGIFGANEQTRRDFEALNRQMGGKLTVDTDKPSFRRAKKELADLESESDARLKAIRKSMGRETAAGAKAAKENFRDTAKTIERRVRDGELSTEQGMRAIKRLVKTHSEGARGAAVKEFDEMGRKVTRRLRTTKDDGGKQARGLKNAVSGAIGDMGDFVNGALKSLGLKPINFKASKVAGDVASGADKIASGEVRASGGFAGMFAGGGLIGRWGERGRDKVHAILGRGEAVLNHYQQRAVNAALRMTGIARGGLPDLFRRTKNTRHYMASGGMAGEGASISDYYPSAYASGGIVAVPGSPGEYANKAILDEIAWAKSNFAGLVLTDAFGPGHKSPGHTVTGTAADFSGPDAAMDRAVKALVAKGFLVGYDGRFGSQDWPGHGPSTRTPNFHFHVEFGSGAGAIKGGVPGGILGVPEIPGFKIGGPDGPLRDMGQKLVSVFRKRAQRMLGEKLGASLGTPTAHGHALAELAASTELEDIDHTFPMHTPATAAGHTKFSEGLIQKIMRWVGLPSMFLPIDKGETGHMPGNTGYDPNGYSVGRGLWQPTREVWGEDSALAKFQDALGGPMQMYNPLKAAKMTRFHFDNAPSKIPNTPGFPWDGTKYLASGGFAGDGVSIGDYMPSAGGLASGGFADSPYLNSGPIPQMRDKIERLETRYQNKSARFDVSDETFIIDGDGNTPPTIDMGAVKQRQSELSQLVAIRQQIVEQYGKLVWYMRTLQRVLEQNRKNLTRMVKQVRESLKNLAPGKKNKKRRDALEGRLSEYMGSLKSTEGNIGAVGAELLDEKSNLYQAETSLLADRNEMNALLPGVQADFAGKADRGGGDDADLQAQLDQANQKVADLENFKRIAQQGFDVFQGPGDIGAGASYALRAAQNPGGTPEGPGAGLGLAIGPDGRLVDSAGQPASGPFGASGQGATTGPTIEQNIYTLHPGDPATLAAIGSAATAGQSLQGAVQANRKAVKV